MVKVIKKSENIYEIPKEGEMNVPGIIFASEKILEDIKKDQTLEQVMNVATLPGILKYSIALPDAHRGYGFSIGGVAAFDLKTGVISPGGVGYDINCSVRLLKTNLTKKDIENKKLEVMNQLQRDVPSGVGRGSSFNISRNKFYEILKGGAQWMVKNGFGVKEDYLHTEEEGMI